MKYFSKIRPIHKFIAFFSKKQLVDNLINEFLHPIKHQPTDREEAFYKSAKEIKMLIPTINKEIIVYEYGYSKNKDLLVHGWSGRASQFYILADKLLAKGRMIVTFDAPAHGNSSGSTSSMNEIIEIINFLNKKYNFKTAIGHSIGAMAILQTEATVPKFFKIVSIAATNNVNEIISKFLATYNVSSKITSRFKKQFSEKTKTNLTNYNGVTCAKKIQIPTLIIHDSQDKPSHVSSAYEIRQNLSKGEILITYRLGHTRILTNSEVNKRILNFIIDV